MNEKLFQIHIFSKPKFSTLRLLFVFLIFSLDVNVAASLKLIGQMILVRPDLLYLGIGLSINGDPEEL